MVRIHVADWVRHPTESGAPTSIYGVDVHPDGRRFATAGRDGTARVWSLAALVSRAAGAPDAAVRGCAVPSSAAAAAATAAAAPAPAGALLATLTDHEGSVLCCRWAHSGRWLATGSDDKYVFLWERRGGAARRTLGSRGAANAENWCRCSSLRGHSLDVVDVAWAPSDAMLATASLDNSVIVWALPPRGAALRPVLAPTRVLGGHVGYVKGVAWDPLGRYLASACSSTLHVWGGAAADWALKTKVTRPFDGAGDITFFQRPSWAADGTVVCAANALEAGKPVAVLVEMGDAQGRWNDTVTLVGHKGPVVATRFSPLLYAAPHKSGGAIGCVALGGQDHCLSVWNSGATRPLLTLENGPFRKPITDISWGRDGRTLLATSHDGSLCAVSFDPHELGVPLDANARAQRFKALYGDTEESLLAQGGGQAGRAHDDWLVENPATLLVQDSAKAAAAAELSERAAAQRNAAADADAARAAAEAAQAADPRSTLERQVESRARNGKKRIAPVLMSGGAAGGALHERAAPAFDAAETGSLPPPSPDAPQQRPAVAAAAAVLAAAPGPAPATTIHRPPTKRKRPRQDVPVPNPAKDSGQMPPPPQPRAAGPLVPPRSSPMSRMVEASTTAPVVIECSAAAAPAQDFAGALAGGARRPLPGATRLTLSRAGAVVWRTTVVGRATALAGDHSRVVLGTSDAAVHIFNRAGVRLVPPLVVAGGAISLIELTFGALLVVTADGALHRYCSRTLRHVASTTVAPPLYSVGRSHDADTLVQAQVVAVWVADDGSPLGSLRVAVRAVEVHAAQTFAFAPDQQAWLRLEDSRHGPSDFMSLLDARPGATGQPPPPLAPAVSAAAAASLSAAALLDQSSGAGGGPSTAHLEEMVAAAAAAGRPDDLRHWVRLAIRWLGAASDEQRLRAWFDALLGHPPRPDTPPPHPGASDARPPEWWLPSARHIAGVPKLDLLEEMLQELGQNAGMARLVAEYSQVLKAAVAAECWGGSESGPSQQEAVAETAEAAAAAEAEAEAKDAAEPEPEPEPAPAPAKRRRASGRRR